MSSNSLRWLKVNAVLPVLAVALAGELRAAESTPARTTSALRELSTDRPDSTESPFTVDRGHVQLEMDVASFTRNRLDGVKTTEWVIAPFNVRYGITPEFEAGVFFTPHIHLTEQPRGGAKTKLRGIGDTVLRGKINLWGNDGGPTAFGMFLDVKLPTAADGLGNDKVEGAITFPFAFELGAGWDAAAMTSVENVHTDEHGRRAVWVNTFTMGREILPDTGVFFEIASAAGDGAHVATFNCGVTRRFGPNLQLDCGANFGITRTAPDLSFFAGFSRKF
jgi:hypothetical protein